MIEKNHLQSIISRYYLGGLIESVKWEIQNNTLNVYTFFQRLISFILIIAISYNIFNYSYIMKNSGTSPT